MTWFKPLYKKWTNPVYCRLWLQVKAPGEKTVTVVCWLWQCTSLWRTQSLDEYLRVFFPMKYDVSWTLISLTEKSEIWWYDWPIRAWSNGCVADVAWCHSNVDILEWIYFKKKSPFEVYFKQNLLIVKTVFWFTLMALLWPWWCETAVQMCDQMQQDGQTYLFIDMLLQHVWLLVVSRTSNWC